MNTLTCSKCLLSKPIGAFYEDKRRAQHGRIQPCKKCRQEYQCAKRAANLEKAREQDRARHVSAKKRAWYAANTDKINEQQRARRAANPEKSRMYDCVWYAANADTVLAKKRTVRLANPDKIRKRQRASNAARLAANPSKVRAQQTASNNRRRAAQANAPLNDLTHTQWLEIQVAQRHRCVYCGKRCKGKLTQDHIQPISKGGSHTLHNVIGACGSCNSSKGTKSPPCPVQTLLLTIAPAKKKAI